MNCFMCNGAINDKTTTFLVDVDNCIVIVKNVPSQVCSQCGETSYTDEVASQLETMVTSAKMALAEISVINYNTSVA